MTHDMSSGAWVHWYSRPVGAISVLMLSMVTAVWLMVTSPGTDGRGDGAVFAVTMTHDGVDAATIETTITIPLEEALAVIPGVVSIRSRSEYGSSVVVAEFAPGLDADIAGQQIRDAAYDTHARLPAAVRRPRFDSADPDASPSWVAVLWSDGVLPEADLRQIVSGVDGVGRVDIGGFGRGRLVIAVDGLRAGATGLAPGDIASRVADSDGVYVAGTVRSGSAPVAVEHPVLVRSPYTTARSLAGMPVAIGNGIAVPLASLADVSEGFGTSDTVSRMDGRSVVTLAVVPDGSVAGSLGLAALSRRLDKALGHSAAGLGLSYQVVRDRGAEAGTRLASTFGALLVGCAAMMAAVVFMPAHGRAAAMVPVTLSVPVVLVISGGMLALSGAHLDAGTLAGLAAGLGASLDTVILVASRIGAAVPDGVASGTDRAGKAVLAVVPPVLAGVATTVVVIAPLVSLEVESPGVAGAGLAVAATSVSAALFALTVVPPVQLFLMSSESDLQSGRRQLRPGTGRLERAMWRVSAWLTGIVTGLPWLPLAVAAGLTAMVVPAVMFVPVRPSVEEQSGSMALRVEFYPGTPAISVDAELAVWTGRALRWPGVLHIQYNASRNSGTMYLVFDADTTDAETLAAMALADPPHGGFVWIPGNGSDAAVWSVSVLGDDPAICRSAAGELASALASQGGVEAVALGFRDDARAVRIQPRAGLLASVGLRPVDVAWAARQACSGTVSHKRYPHGLETDVLVYGVARQSPESRNAAAEAVPQGVHPSTLDRVPLLTDVLAATVSAAGVSVPLSSLVDVSVVPDVLAIVRQDGRRSASISVRTATTDPREAGRLVDEAGRQIRLPSGYSILFDRAAGQGLARIHEAGSAMILAVALAMVVAGIATDSLVCALSVPVAALPSLTVPFLLLVMSGQPVSLQLVCAFVSVSGMVTNAAVLMGERLVSLSSTDTTLSPSGVYRVIREELPQLSASVSAAVLGSAPLVLSSPAGSLSGSMAFVAVAGSIVSLPVAVLVIPSMFKIFPKGAQHATSTIADAVRLDRTENYGAVHLPVSGPGGICVRPGSRGRRYRPCSSRLRPGRLGCRNGRRAKIRGHRYLAAVRGTPHGTRA